MLWLWGIAGAFVYATNALILALWNDGTTPSGRYRAVVEYVAALATGAIFAQGFTNVIVRTLGSGVNLNGYQMRMDVDVIAVALTVGWSSNYLWPRVLRKLGKRVDAIAIEERK